MDKSIEEQARYQASIEKNNFAISNALMEPCLAQRFFSVIDNSVYSAVTRALQMKQEENQQLRDRVQSLIDSAKGQFIHKSDIQKALKSEGGGE